MCLQLYFFCTKRLYQQHTLKKLVPETCTSRLVQETCTCVGQSCTSFSGIGTSFLHANEHSSISAQKLSST